MTKTAHPDDAPPPQHRTPHDTLIKTVLARAEDAAVLLRTVLPRAIADAIDWRHFERRDTELPDEERSPTRTDLLFATTIDGSDARVFVIFEHQSTDDPWMPLRLARSVLAILLSARHAVTRVDHDASAKLPLVLPVIFAHTPGGWRTHRALSDLVPTHERMAPLRAHLLQLAPVLIDLTGAEHAQVVEWAQALARAQAVPQAVMLRLLVVTRRTRSRDREAARAAVLALIPEIAPWLASLIRARDPLLADLERYTLQLGHVSALEYEQRLAEVLDEDAMPTLTLREQYIRELEAAGRDRWLAEGIEKGIEKGIEAGVERGQAEHARRTLRRLLTQRFGTGAVAQLQDRIEHASLEALDAALDRVLEASSVADVFDV